MSVQFGVAPKRSLSQKDRDSIGKLLKRTPEELGTMLLGFDEIIAAYSADAQPLADKKKLQTARDDLRKMRVNADALATAIDKADQQVKLRLILGSAMTGTDGERPIGDFSRTLARFKNLLREIDEALKPPKGGRAHGDRLRAVTYLCAIQYYKATGIEPARRNDGVFRKITTIVLAAIGLEFPKDPYKLILKPAIDRAMANEGPEQTPRSS